MKPLIAVIALVSFGIFVPVMHADDLALNLGAAGLANVDLGPVSAGAGAVTYDALNVPLFDLQQGILGGALNLNFTAVFVDAGATLPNGAILPAGSADALVVTETCVGALVTLGGVSNPCSGLSFLYTNDNVGNILGVTGALNIGGDVDASVAGLGADVSIGGGTETIGFGNPPSATPEPGTLSLMGTGLLGVAGVIRRKFRV